MQETALQHIANQLTYRYKSLDSVLDNLFARDNYEQGKVTKDALKEFLVQEAHVKDHTVELLLKTNKVTERNSILTRNEVSQVLRPYFVEASEKRDVMRASSDSLQRISVPVLNPFANSSIKP